MNIIRAALMLALLLAGCTSAPPVKRNWEWVGAGPEPGEGKLLEQYSVCSGAEPASENTLNLCMGAAGWIQRQRDDPDR